MPRSLNTNVFVNGNWYGPGQIPPAEVAELITNPKVWDGDEDTKHPAEPTALERPAGNASREKWAAYASQEGLEVTDDMQRDDIKAAFDQSKG